MDFYTDRIRELEAELEQARFSAEIWRRLYVDTLEERDELKAKLETALGSFDKAEGQRDEAWKKLDDLKTKMRLAQTENADLKAELKHVKSLVREHLKALVRETSECRF